MKIMYNAYKGVSKFMIDFYFFIVLIMVLIGSGELYFSKFLNLKYKKITLSEELKKYINDNEVNEISLKYSKIFKYTGLFSLITGIVSIIFEPIISKYDYLSIILIYLCISVILLLLLIVLMYTIANIKKSTADKQSRWIFLIMIIVFAIGPYLDNIAYNAKNLYGAVVTTKINPNEEFILFKCKSDNHKAEKVYMSINDIYKNKDNDIILDVNLRYKGKNSINLYGNDSFDDLSGFYAEAASIEDRNDSKGFYASISNKLVKRCNPQIDNLNTTVSNGDIINIKVPIETKGSKVEDFEIKDLKFKIHKTYSGAHYGLGSFQYIILEK